MLYNIYCVDAVQYYMYCALEGMFDTYRWYITILKRSSSFCPSLILHLDTFISICINLESILACSG
jgi:hypothetical protein